MVSRVSQLVRWFGYRLYPVLYSTVRSEAVRRRTGTAWSPVTTRTSVPTRGNEIRNLHDKHRYPAANIATVVIATTVHPRRELGWPCISFLSEATIRIATRRKGANSPLMTAVQ